MLCEEGEANNNKRVVIGEIKDQLHFARDWRVFLIIPIGSTE